MDWATKTVNCLISLLTDYGPCSRIYISQFKNLINRKDTRSARNWCSKNNVTIHKDCSGEFVYKTDFELAYDMPLIKDLKKRYRDNWKECYVLFKNGKAYEALEFNTDSARSKSYSPKGKLAKKLLDGLWK